MSKPDIKAVRKLAKFALEQQLGYYGIDSDDTKELSRAFLALDAENAKLRKELRRLEKECDRITGEWIKAKNESNGYRAAITHAK